MSEDSERRDEVISVGDLDRMLRRAVEQATGRVWVEGEVTALRRVGSGHVYFVLKDEREDAVIDCVMYRFQAQRAARHLADGARVQLYGRATIWAPRGKLQLVVESARPAGRGELLARLEALKEKLHAEGLFDVERKRPLPREPQLVGVVTSRHGAAFADIVKVAHARGRVRIVISPALVQGEGSARSIVEALDRLERLAGVDVIIVGRGGGSAEDLMSFNDERVVRRIASCAVPVVSAVGHEIDTTLADLAADVRAATPSHAAEICVRDEATERQAVARAVADLSRAMHTRLGDDRSTVLRLRQKLADPRFLIADKQQLLDDLRARIERQTERGLARQRMGAANLVSRLQARHPRAVVLEARRRLEPLSLRLDASARVRTRRARAELAELSSQLYALSPLRVLERGYAIVRTEDGRVLRRAGDAARGDAVEIRLHRGHLRATVSDVEDGKDEP